MLLSRDCTLPNSNVRFERVDRAVAAEAGRDGEEPLADVLSGYLSRAFSIAGSQGVENLPVLACRSARAFGRGDSQVPGKGTPQRRDVVGQPGDPAAFV